MLSPILVNLFQMFKLMFKLKWLFKIVFFILQLLILRNHILHFVIIFLNFKLIIRIILKCCNLVTMMWQEVHQTKVTSLLYFVLDYKGKKLEKFFRRGRSHSIATFSSIILIWSIVICIARLIAKYKSIAKSIEIS